MADKASRHPADDLRLVTGWVAVLWAIEILDVGLSLLLLPRTVPGWPWTGGYLDLLLGLHPWDLGRPGDLTGLVGVPCAPLLHAGFGHLAANTVALLILGSFSCWFSRKLTGTAVILSALIGGLFTWLIAAPGAVHVGASGVIFGLVGFLIANAIFRRSLMAILVALPVAWLYGSAIYYGMLPHTVDDRISWQMHLGGFIGGVLASWGLRKEKTS